MSPFVDLERGLLGERLVAEVARERLFAGVAAFVRLEDGQVGKALAALPARVGPFAGVCSEEQSISRSFIKYVCIMHM